MAGVVYQGEIPMSTEAGKTNEWHVFGQQDSVEWDVLLDVGLVLLGGSPKKHEWVEINKDRTAYRVGPIVDGRVR